MMTPLSIILSRKLSILCRPTFPNPSFRLTGMVTANRSIKDVRKEMLESRDLLKRSFSPWTNEKMVIYFRNIFAKALMCDDDLRLHRTHLEKEITNQEKISLFELIKEIKNKIEKLDGSFKQPKLLGELARVCAALEVRLGTNNGDVINDEEKQKLFELFSNLRLKQAKHLVNSSLLEFNHNRIQLAKAASLSERHQYLDDICPLHLGIDQNSLQQFISELAPEAQNILLSLLEQRKKAVENDGLWQKLIEHRLSERKKLETSLENVHHLANNDTNMILENHLFARLLLDYGKHFLDDLYQNHYLFKFITLLSYFRSPHISILFDEQHLNKQMKAADEQLKEDTNDPFLLLIRSEKTAWIAASQIPYRNVYIPDQFQSLVRAANLRNLDSSSQVEKNQVFYLPHKGLCNHDPTNLPENIEDLSPFFIHSTNSRTYTPAVSFRAENAMLKGTHAFVKLTNDKKSYFIGKFSYFRFTYESIKTYWLFLKNVVPTLLGNQPTRILNPDQNLGYHDRSIAYLDNPIPITRQQIEEIYSLTRAHHQQLDGREFKIITKNCTALPEEILKVVGIHLPCRAPLHILLKQTNPLASRAVKWMSYHPLIANSFLIPLGWAFGAKGQNRLTTQTLDQTLTPYVLRTYISLKNCTDNIEKVKSSIN